MGTTLEMKEPYTYRDLYSTLLYRLSKQECYNYTTVIHFLLLAFMHTSHTKHLPVVSFLLPKIHSVSKASASGVGETYPSFVYLTPPRLGIFGATQLTGEVLGKMLFRQRGENFARR